MLKAVQSKLQVPFGITPSDSPNKPATPSQIQWTQQLHAYVAWVNSQLRKKSGCRLVTDLRNDFRDGTALANLLEIVGGTKLDGVDYNPSSTQSKRNNVQKALQFMAKHNMDIHSVSVKDINDGHLKSTMRLVLAIAKHYKPNTVTNGGGSGGDTKTRASAPSTPNYGSLDSRRTGGNLLQQNFGVKRPGVSSNPSPSNGHRTQNGLLVTHRPRTIDPRSFLGNRNPSSRPHRNSLSKWSDGDYAGSDSDGSGRHSPELRIQTSFTHSTYSLNERLINGGGEVDGASSIGSPTSSLNKIFSNRSSSVCKTSLSSAKSLPCLKKISDMEGYRDYENYPQADFIEKLSIKSSDKDSDNRLLSGHPNEAAEQPSEQTNTTFGGTSAEEKLVALQSYLQMTSEKCHDLQSNLKKSQYDFANLEDVKSNLHEKVVEQDKCILEMKQEIAKLQLENQSLETTNQELTKSLEVRDVQTTELKRQLSSKDKLIHQQKQQLDDAIRNFSAANKSKALLTSRLVEQDRKIALLEQARNHKTPMREELQIVRDTLQSLRNGFKSNDPQHHTIDTLEQSFALLMERLHLADMQKLSNGQLESKRLNFDSTGDPRRFPLSSYQSYCLQKFENGHSTKVVYFTEKTLTPFMSSIPKRLGEIKLIDFKTMFDRQGNFRYHFKSMDPEYGMVKEEVMQDDDVLPGWDGKIIAWVEEDHG